METTIMHEPALSYDTIRDMDVYTLKKEIRRVDIHVLHQVSLAAPDMHPMNRFVAAGEIYRRQHRIQLWVVTFTGVTAVATTLMALILWSA
jgi:hypothetical protein